MNNKEQRLQFEASANLQRLIGRELVPNEEVALVELVKNAYDSGAQHAVISIQPPSNKDPGYIEVRDDGEGMALDNLRRIFMVAGYSERPEQVDTAERVPTGEKGIGRFATDRLGQNLTVFTKVRGVKNGIEVNINWDVFSNKKKKFHDITVPYKLGRIAAFKQEASGTILRITKLNSPWRRQKLELLRSTLAELLDPFHKPRDFEIVLRVIGSETLSAPIEQEPPTGADIELTLKVLNDGTVSRRLRGTLLKHSEIAQDVSTSANTKALATLAGRFLYFIKRPSKALTRGMQPGMRLYRDGFRVEPFGSPTADWLGISEKRAKRAGHAHIVPSRLFGFVEISRQEHPELRDTTSRQALIDGEAARALVTFLKEQLRFLEEKIRTEVTEPRWKEGQTRKAVEFEQARLQTLGIMSFGLAHELRQPLQSIRSEADNIKVRLKQLDINDEDIKEAQGNIDAGIDRIDKNIDLIADISKGNANDIVTFDLSDTIRGACHLFQTRCDALGINLIVNVPNRQEAAFNRMAVQSVLLNLLRNSIDSLEEVKETRKMRKISVALSKKGNTHALEVTDNGIGIPEDIRPKIFKRFATKKTGGMGVGLYYCKLIISAHGGDIRFSSRQDVGSTFTVTFSDRKK